MPYELDLYTLPSFAVATLINIQLICRDLHLKNAFIHLIPVEYSVDLFQLKEWALETLEHMGLWGWMIVLPDGLGQSLF